MYFYFDKLYNPVPTDREYYVVYHQLNKKIKEHIFAGMEKPKDEEEEKKPKRDKLTETKSLCLLGILCVFNDDKKLILPHLTYGNLRNNKTIFKAIKALENKLKEGLQ